jgi:hypothetical protein
MDAPYVVAVNMVHAALDWCHMDADSWITHSKQGWNQDPYYFARCVKRAYLKHNSLWGNDPLDLTFTERQFRFGGKRINRWLGITR